ncbi:TPA: hypothetical protein L7126_000582 [Klebsiella pneumoniae]|uniref:hypothetical protein n=5 Tax=Klebsiella variicola TaxID=244366 RepID=UPI001E44D1BC|nr:hypothetical protein [Klebsiella variicola]HBQ4033067.1 hypothetical protein [Klebsiella pneumoniae]EKZ6694603.1 hypothetical protein [Klebsiella variicola]MCD9773827.1 hypothetical protein [Klebsiella variicola subsp. variicola]HBQ5099008.1 hypothetical protein [Klebsiella variicola]HBQ5124688.1 hypothetical protein [Klebsiella variicola]
MKEINIPILIANFKPFRLISRDDSDIWNPSLEQINNSTYDYVKLHRASRFFNAHLPKPMPACLGFDGSLIFPFIDEFKNENLVVEEVNRILASIFIGGVYVEAIMPLDVSRGKMNITGYYRHCTTHSSNANFHHAIGECDAGSLASIRLLKPEVISADKIISAYDYGHKVLSKLPTVSPSLFIGAFTYYKQHQLCEALAHAWISIEQMLELVWKKTIVEDTKSVNIHKRRKFIESQQWNSAHKIEMLFQNKYLCEETYSFLSKARFARNDFIHKGLTPSYEETHSALMSLISLVEVSSKINEVDFEWAKIYQNIPNVGINCIPQTSISNKKERNDPDVKYWREVKKIPGDKDWEGQFESYPDITLSAIGTIED